MRTNDPNKPLTAGTRVRLPEGSAEHFPTGVWMTLMEKASWDDAEWWKAVTDRGDTVWLLADGEILANALVESP